MTMPGDTTGELSRLFWAVREGQCSSEDLAKLEDLLHQRPDLRESYIRFTMMCGMLRYMRASSVEAGTARDVPIPPTAPVLPHGSLPIAIHSADGFLSSGWPVAYLVATVIFAVALSIAAFVRVSQPVYLALPSPSGRGAGGEGGGSMASPLPSVVGRITGMVDCRWSDPTTEAILGAYVPLGRKYALSSGLMEITYDTGAKVILQGPVTYEVESPTGGFLSIGKLTAKLEKGLPSPFGRGAGGEGGLNSPSAIKSQISNQKSETLNPNSPDLCPLTSDLFAIRTPTALVTDLGTEFGVEVDQRGNTTSHVFRGVVRLQRVVDGEAKEEAALVLHQNQSARVNSHNSDSLMRLDPTEKPVGFVRAMPRKVGKTLDLVDLVAGGDGFSGRRNRGIDPTTGRISARSPATFLPTFAGNHKCHRVRGLSFVDGVFIPNGAAGPVQVDSAGHMFDGFGKTDNLTYGHIWAGEPVVLATGLQAIRPDLGGIDFTSAGHGALLIHANGGVAFNLEAIRTAIPGCRISRFRAVAGNLAASMGLQDNRAAVYILVDGKPRFVQKNWVGNGSPVFVNAPIKEDDRFLTLAFTDGGDGCGWDWTILGDPRLELMVTETMERQDSKTE